jgi:hypothetical protein
LQKHNTLQYNCFHDLTMWSVRFLMIVAVMAAHGLATFNNDDQTDLEKRHHKPQCVAYPTTMTVTTYVTITKRPRVHIASASGHAFCQSESQDVNDYPLDRPVLRYTVSNTATHTDLMFIGDQWRRIGTLSGDVVTTTAITSVEARRDTMVLTSDGIVLGPEPTMTTTTSSQHASLLSRNLRQIIVDDITFIEATATPAPEKPAQTSQDRVSQAFPYPIVHHDTLLEHQRDKWVTNKATMSQTTPTPAAVTLVLMNSEEHVAESWNPEPAAATTAISNDVIHFDDRRRELTTKDVDFSEAAATLASQHTSTLVYPVTLNGHVFGPSPSVSETSLPTSRGSLDDHWRRSVSEDSSIISDTTLLVTRGWRTTSVHLATSDGHVYGPWAVPMATATHSSTQSTTVPVATSDGTVFGPWATGPPMPGTFDPEFHESIALEMAAKYGTTTPKTTATPTSHSMAPRLVTSDGTVYGPWTTTKSHTPKVYPLDLKRPDYVASDTDEIFPTSGMTVSTSDGSVYGPWGPQPTTPSEFGGSLEYWLTVNPADSFTTASEPKTTSASA